MTRDLNRGDFSVDPRGFLIERTTIGGEDVIIHYRDIPESDITILHGIPVTTALRTIIDMAPEVDHDALTHMVRDCLDRRLFTVDEARARIDSADMASDPGAEALRWVLGQT